MKDLSTEWSEPSVVGYHVAILADDQRSGYLHCDSLGNHSMVVREQATLFPTRQKAMGRAAHFMDCFAWADARVRPVTRRWRTKGTS